MQRLLTAAALIAALAAAAQAPVAQAETRDPALTLSVRYTAAELRDPAAFQALQQRIADKAEAFCRANPIGGTVSECRRVLTQQLQVQAQTRRLAILSAPDKAAYAAR